MVRMASSGHQDDASGLAIEAVTRRHLAAGRGNSSIGDVYFFRIAEF